MPEELAAALWFRTRLLAIIADAWPCMFCGHWSVCVKAPDAAKSGNSLVDTIVLAMLIVSTARNVDKKVMNNKILT